MEERLNLLVTVNPNAGFCHGVKRAIRMAEDLLSKGEKVYCIGKIVHNTEEVNRLEAMGMQTITHEELSQLKKQTVLFRAHGEPASTYAMAEANGNKVVDASCRVVLKLQDRIRLSHENGEHIYIFGKKDHPEMKGLLSQAHGKAIAFEEPDQLDFSRMPKEITLYSQTTKSLARFYEIAGIFENRGITVNLKDTVCRQVHNREARLSDFCKAHHKNIFVAGSDSSNGKVLYQICKAANQNTWFISESSEIKREWFEADDIVGISGATSTPVWQMVQLKEFLEKW